MKSLPHLPRVHHQQGKVIPHSSVLCLGSSLLLTVGWWKICLTVLYFHWWSCKYCFSYHKVDPRHPDAFCNIAECSIIENKIKCYCTISNLVLCLLYPILFPRFLSIPYRSAYLACSFSLPHAMCVYNFHDCKLWEFSHTGSQQVTPVPRAHSHPLQVVGPRPLPDSVQPAPATTSSHTFSPPHNFIQLLHSVPLRLLQPLQSAEPGASTFTVFGIPFV